MYMDSVMMPLEETICEVNSQPEAVSAAINANHSSIVELAQIIVNKNINHLYLVGSGDSMFAGQCVEQAYREYARTPLIITQAYEYAIYGDVGINENSAVIVISSSGRLSTTRDALDRALSSKALVIGITDYANIENPFFSKPQYKLIPGAVKKGWPTQTTTATIMLLLDLAIQMGKLNGTLSKHKGEELFEILADIPLLMKNVLHQSSSLTKRLGQKLVAVETMYFIGSGQGYGVANIGGALMAEGPQRVGVPLYVEEFHHSLRVHTIDLGMPIFLIAPRDPAYQRYLDTVEAVKHRGGYITVIINKDNERIESSANTIIRIPEVPYEMSPLLSLLPLQQFSIELTKSRLASGYQRPWDSD